MADEIIDRKITQSEMDKMMAPLELDMMALFNVIKNEMLTEIEKFKGTPDDFIDTVLDSLEFEERID